jgi:hypothetical protein
MARFVSASNKSGNVSQSCKALNLRIYYFVTTLYLDIQALFNSTILRRKKYQETEKEENSISRKYVAFSPIVVSMIKKSELDVERT